MKISGVRKYILLAILFLSNVVVIGAEFYGVIMTQMYTSYPEWAVNLAMSIPGIVGMLACLLIGKISDKVDKKIIFIAGLIIFGISASNLALPGNSLIMIIMACFNGGVCYGLVSVSALGIITKVYTDETARSRVMGLYTGSIAIIGAGMNLIYGQFAEINWTMAGFPNWITVVLAIIAVFVVPSCKPDGTVNTSANEKVVGEKGWAKRLIPLIIAFFCVSFAFVSVNNYIDLYVTANNLGGSAFTSTCSSTQMIFSFIFNCIFGFTYSKLGTKLTIFGYASMAASVILLIFFPVKAVVIVAFALLGMGWGSVYSFWFFRTTVVVPEKMVGTATGLVTTFNSLSYFPVPYVLTGAMAFMNTENSRDVFPIYAASLVVALVLSTVINLKNRGAGENAEAKA